MARLDNLSERSTATRIRITPLLGKADTPILDRAAVAAETTMTLPCINNLQATAVDGTITRSHLEFRSAGDRQLHHEEAEECGS
jgi:hypothetical protein